MTKIVPLDINNYTEIVGLWEIAGLIFKPQGRDSYKFLENRLKTSATWLFGTFSQDILIGVVIVSHDGQRGWINRLAVDPQYRGKGLGRDLLKYSEEFLKKQGIELYCALIEEDNLGSQQLFSSNGFVKHDDIRYFSKRESQDY